MTAGDSWLLVTFFFFPSKKVHLSDLFRPGWAFFKGGPSFSAVHSSSQVRDLIFQVSGGPSFFGLHQILQVSGVSHGPDCIP